MLLYIFRNPLEPFALALLCHVEDRDLGKVRMSGWGFCISPRRGIFQKYVCSMTMKAIL